MLSEKSLATDRTDYVLGELTEDTAGDDPIRLFTQWLEAAAASGIREPNAMTLATSTPTGRPSARIVLLRQVDERGFVFYTNYDSRKGKELDLNPQASLVFHWAEMERQVRVEGEVHRVSQSESDDYFASRPTESRIGAIASAQSEVIASREALEQQVQQVRDKHGVQSIPRPSNWGGYRLVPAGIEFWQGRPSRLHDRLLFVATETSWERCRLSP